MERMRILLVDDHVLFRKGMAALLASRRDMEVVGEASNGQEAMIKARETRPNVILMDITMPICDGLEATYRIKQEMPHMKILILTVSDDDKNLFGAIKAGADGYLLKNLEPYQLYDMLDGVRRAEVALSGAMAAKILNEFRHPAIARAEESDSGTELTHREIEVLEQVVTGASNREIAEGLCIAENTVKIHLRNILEKLHLHNRIQAAVYAVRQGLVYDPA